MPDPDTQPIILDIAANAAARGRIYAFNAAGKAKPADRAVDRAMDRHSHLRRAGVGRLVLEAIGTDTRAVIKALAVELQLTPT